MSIEDEIYDYTFRLIKKSITKNIGGYKCFYYDVDYIKRFKLYTLSGKSKPKFIYNNEHIIFRQGLNIFWINVNIVLYLENKYSLSYGYITHLLKEILYRILDIKYYTILIDIIKNGAI